MIDVKFILIFASVVLLTYTSFSYPILKLLKVKDRLIRRSLYFGTSIFLIQFSSSGIGALSGAVLIGNIVGLVGSYYFVKKVLDVKLYINLAIVVLLPIVAAPIILLVLFLYSGGPWI